MQRCRASGPCMAGVESHTCCQGDGPELGTVTPYPLPTWIALSQLSAEHSSSSSSGRPRRRNLGSQANALHDGLPCDYLIRPCIARPRLAVVSPGTCGLSPGSSLFNLGLRSMERVGKIRTIMALYD